jgi:hypothetical protein
MPDNPDRSCACCVSHTPECPAFHARSSDFEAHGSTFNFNPDRSAVWVQSFGRSSVRVEVAALKAFAGYLRRLGLAGAPVHMVTGDSAATRLTVCGLSVRDQAWSLNPHNVDCTECRHSLIDY